MTALAAHSRASLDELTLRRAQRGDEQAWRALIERFQSPVHALIWRLLAGRARHRVEDLVQETFVRVYACAAHEIATAREMFAKVPPQFQPSILQRCQQEGLDPGRP